MSSNSDSSLDDTPRPLNSQPVPQRPAPPRIPKIPPPPEVDQPPPYYPSNHAQSSSLLGGRETQQTATQRPVSTLAANRNSRASGSKLRQRLRHVNKWVLIIGGLGLAVLIILLISFAVWLGTDEPIELPQTFDSSSDRHILPLDVKWKLLGAFREFEQKMTFDENSDAVFLSKYFPEEHMLKCEKLVASKHHDGFIYSNHNVSSIYADCVCFTDDVTCCSTSPHEHQHRTDCYLNTNDQIIHSVASHFDFMQNWQSLADDSKLAIVFNRQRHAILNLRTKRIHRIEENRLPHGYVSVAFFFPLDNSGELDELVRSGEEFRVCEYKQTQDENYALQAPECRTTPFHVEFELPKVKFCSNPIYTAVVQYGHLADEGDLTFKVKVMFDGETQVYGAQDALATPYDQLVIDCNEDIEVYVMGEAEVAQFTMKLPNLRSERYIQTRI